MCRPCIRSSRLSILCDNRWSFLCDRTCPRPGILLFLCILTLPSNQDCLPEFLSVLKTHGLIYFSYGGAVVDVAEVWGVLLWFSSRHSFIAFISGPYILDRLTGSESEPTSMFFDVYHGRTTLIMVSSRGTCFRTGRHPRSTDYVCVKVGNSEHPKDSHPDSEMFLQYRGKRRLV